MSKEKTIHIYEPSEEFIENVEALDDLIIDVFLNNECTVNEVQAALMMNLLRAIDGSDDPEMALNRTIMSLHMWADANLNEEIPEGVTLQ